MSYRSRLIRLIAVGACALCASACQPAEQITRYKAPKPPKVESTSVEESRMLAAIIPNADQAWFFKFSGPSAAMEQHAKTFHTFVKSVKFEEGKPRWKLPEGWTEESGRGMRFATIKVPGGAKPLELTVTELDLPRGEQDPDQYVLANVNRWRDQLQLEPIAAADLPRETTKIKLAGTTATVVDLTGKSQPEAGMPPFAGGGRTFPETGPRDTASPKQPLSFKAPPEWQPGRSSPFSVAAFEVARDGRTVKITVSSAGGSVLANVNRWRGQLGLPELTEEALQKELKKIDVGPLKGDYVKLVSGGEGSPEQKPEAILGVIVQIDSRTWFFKLYGDRELAESEQARFEKFVQSVRLTGSEGGGNGQ